MNRRLALTIAAVAVLATGCGRLGTGLPGCDQPTRSPSSATVLTLQAVPTAKYSPCIDSIRLGWDEVEFDVERDLMRLEFGREFSSFFEVTLRPSCDVGDAAEVPSGMEDVTRFEAIDQVTNEIRVTVIPNAERPLLHARELIADLAGIRVDNRPVVFTIDEDIDFSVSARINKALFTDQFVWIIGDLDIDEGTVELRATRDREGAQELKVADALNQMDAMSPDVRYKGQWFFVFEGGCITYDFDAEGSVATSIANDAEDAIGFYPNGELREMARNSGYTLIDEPAE